MPPPSTVFQLVNGTGFLFLEGNFAIVLYPCSLLLHTMSMNQDCMVARMSFASHRRSTTRLYTVGRCPAKLTRQIRGHSDKYASKPCRQTHSKRKQLYSKPNTTQNGRVARLRHRENRSCQGTVQLKPSLAKPT